MIRHTALLLVLALAAGSARILACESVCPLPQTQVPGCHEDQHRAVAPAGTVSDARHACDHDTDTVPVTGPKLNSVQQTRVDSVAAAAAAIPALTLAIQALRLVARPPDAPAPSRSALFTPLRI